MIDILAAKEVPIEQVALRLGHEVKQHKIRCISKTHRDFSPSLSFDTRLNRFKCFACDLSGDVLDLVQITLGLDLKDAYEWLTGDAKLANITPVPIREYRRVPRLGKVGQLQAFWEACDNSGDWLAYKGLNAGRFGVRQVTQAAHNLIPQFPVGGLFIPYYQHGVITYGRWRSTTPGNGPKSLALPGIDVILYNQDALSGLDGHKRLYLTEGETDTMSLATLGHIAVGFPGASQFQLIPRIQGWLEALKGKIPSLVLAFDDDESGHKLDAKCREAFIDSGLLIYTLNLKGYNDVNEWYINERL